MHDMYDILREKVGESNPNVILPQTVGGFVTDRTCSGKFGDELFKCQDGFCKQCGFVNYFVTEDIKAYPTKFRRFPCDVMFCDQYNVEFVLEEQIKWWMEVPLTCWSAYLAWGAVKRSKGDQPPKLCMKRWADLRAQRATITG